MPRRTALNARQLAVLQRICALGTPVTSADSALAVTVYALRSRGLVTTTWADGQWAAQPTTAGHQYPARLDPTPTVTAADIQQDRQAALSDTSRTRAVSAAGSAVQLIERIQSSGGTLLIADPTPEERACIRRALHAAKTRHLTPPGHCLRYTGRDKGDLVITLLAGGSPQAASPQPYPVRVPSELAPEQLHAAVRDIPLPVCPSCQDRARRLLHALSTAAEREHFTLSPAPSETRACLSISTGPSVFRLFLEESTEQALDPAELKYSWQRVTASTERPTHHLDLRLEHSWAHRGRRGRWGDRQRWRLEDRLPDVLQEIAHRARIEHQRQLEQRQREEETERRWHAAMDRARTEFLEAHRLAQLHKQVAAWQEAALVRAYCDALEQHLRQSITDDESEASTRRWIAWARSWTDRTDPALRSPGFPEDPQATAADLSPYLHGWSPYGPKMR